jgi:hypothetical protein
MQQWDFDTGLTDPIGSGWSVSGQDDSKTASAGIQILESTDELVPYKTVGGAGAAGNISRTFDGSLFGSTTLQIRTAIKLKHNDSAPCGGVGVRLQNGTDLVDLVVSWDLRKFHWHNNFTRSELLPGWDTTDGGEYEFRLVFTGGSAVEAQVLYPDGYPQTIKTDTMPAALTTAGSQYIIGFLRQQDTNDGDVPGDARILRTIVYESGDSIPDDIAIAASVSDDLDKWETLRDGSNTASVDTAISTIGTPTALPGDATIANTFWIRSWTTEAIVPAKQAAWDAALITDLADRFNLLQFLNNVSADARSLIEAHPTLLSGVRLRTFEGNILQTLIDQGSLDVYAGGGTSIPDDVNMLSGDVLEHTAARFLHRIEEVLKFGGGRVAEFGALDSEFVPDIHVGSTHTVDQQARESITPAIVTFPASSPYTDDRATLPNANPLNGVRYREDFRHYGRVLHQTIGRNARTLWPKIQIYYDPLDKIRYRSGILAFEHWHQEWIRTHYAPRHPLSVPYMIELARAHNRVDGTSTPISVGNQLANSTFGQRAIPVDMSRESDNLSLIWGARGIIHWGVDQLWYTETHVPNGANVWAHLKTFKTDVTAIQPTVSNWTVPDRRVAILASHTDYFNRSQHGGGRADTNLENCYRAMATVGEPCDLVFEQELLPAVPTKYKVIIAPQSRYLPQDVVTSLETWITGSSDRYIIGEDSNAASEGSCLQDEATITGTGRYLELDQNYTTEQTRDLDPFYDTTRILQATQTLTASEYEAFLDALVSDLRTKLTTAGITRDCTHVSDHRVAYNRMLRDQSVMHCLVNDERTAGQEVTDLEDTILGQPRSTNGWWFFSGDVDTVNDEITTTNSSGTPVAHGLTTEDGPYQISIDRTISSTDSVPGGLSAYNPANHVAKFTADSGTDTLTSNAHGLSNDDRIALWSDYRGTLPTGLDNTTLYHVVGATTNTFQLSTTQGGGAVNFTDNGTASMYWASGRMYWIIVVDSDTIQLALSAADAGAGTQVDLTSVGQGRILDTFGDRQRSVDVILDTGAAISFQCAFPNHTPRRLLDIISGTVYLPSSGTFTIPLAAGGMAILTETEAIRMSKFAGFVNLEGTLVGGFLTLDSSNVAVNADALPTFEIYDTASSPIDNGTTAFFATGSITDATNASPIVITSASHGHQTGAQVTITGVGGNTAANGTFVITRVDANSYSLDGSTGNGAYTTGGTWNITGFYSYTINATSANQYESGKNYKIVLTYDISGTTKEDLDTFSVQ